MSVTQPTDSATPPLDYAKIGACLVTMLGISRALGHGSVTMSTLYCDHDGALESEVVRGILDECQPAVDLDNRAWLDQFVRDYRLLDVIAEGVTR